MIRFIHTSDLHLGKPFGRFPEDVRARLKTARHDAIDRVAQAARAGGAKYVLIAGDSFDAETPTPKVIRHALNAIRQASDLTWIVMPGNHDSLAANQLWTVIQRDKPENLLLAMEAQPLQLGTRAVVLPAPCAVRHPGRDLTEWMDSAATGEAIRIGLAHGSIRDFRSAEDTNVSANSSVIPPDRAKRAGLSYLGLGDWHGCLKISGDTWYSGTPEADGFESEVPASVLLVTVEAQGAPASVETVPTGSITWCRLNMDCLEGEDLCDRHARAIALHANRTSVLMDIVVKGRASLDQRQKLEAAILKAGPDFLWHAHDMSALAIDHQVEDLDLIDRNGALRTAAEKLQAQAQNAATDLERLVASRALARLFTYALEAE